MDIFISLEPRHLAFGVAENVASQSGDGLLSRDFPSAVFGEPSVFEAELAHAFPGESSSVEPTSFGDHTSLKARAEPS